MTELIIYAAIACAVCFMLYMVLGKQVGESPDKTFSSDKLSKLEPTLGDYYVAPVDPAFKGKAGKGLSEIVAADADFSPKQFLDGANAAFGMILESYADGEKDTLRELLADDVFAAYSNAIDAREADGLTQTTDLARIISNEIIKASRSKKTGSISVEFNAEIAADITDKDGTVVDGDLDILNPVIEVWTFERKLGSNNPNWLLVSVAEAGEDTLGSAPDFNPED